MPARERRQARREGTVDDSETPKKARQEVVSFSGEPELVLLLGGCRF